MSKSSPPCWKKSADSSAHTPQPFRLLTPDSSTPISRRDIQSEALGILEPKGDRQPAPGSYAAAILSSMLLTSPDSHMPMPHDIKGDILD